MTISFKNRHGVLCFLLVTAIYLFTRWLTFKGFNGTDDLHYSMLAHNWLAGTFSPFELNDIFAGRVLLIGWQALIYAVLGVTVFSTQIGSLFAVVTAAAITIFGLAKFKDNISFLLGSSLFYFNPVLNEATIGVMPDGYILLISVFIFWIGKNILSSQRTSHVLMGSVALAALIFAAMFVKENALIFIPFLLLFSIVYGKRRLMAGALVCLVVFSLLVLFSGWVYQYYTGDFFFRAHQILQSDYPNGCNFSLLSFSEKIERLSYGIWRQFIVEGFYPVVLSAGLILLRFFLDPSFAWKKDPTVIAFSLLFLLGVYLPFSLKGYEPMCVVARHFVFLIPLGVIICVRFLKQAQSNKTLQWMIISLSAIMLLVSRFQSVQKWFWMVYTLLLLYFLLQKFSKKFRIFDRRFLIFAFLIWLFTPFRLFFSNSDWFSDMQFLAKQNHGNYYYFPDHDNLMHWKLLHHFDNSIHTVNLGIPMPGFFDVYYEKPERGTFEPGWFLVNKAYLVKRKNTLGKINRVLVQYPKLQQISNGDITLYFLNSYDQLSAIQKALND